jgi:hypothetical protein
VVLPSSGGTRPTLDVIVNHRLQLSDATRAHGRPHPGTPLFADPLHFAYHLRDQVEFQAHGRGYLGPFAHEPATTWAAPHLAGIACRILSLRPDLKPFEMKTILYWLFKARLR